MFQLTKFWLQLQETEPRQMWYIMLNRLRWMFGQVSALNYMEGNDNAEADKKENFPRRISMVLNFNNESLEPRSQRSLKPPGAAPPIFRLHEKYHVTSLKVPKIGWSDLSSLHHSIDKHTDTKRPLSPLQPALAFTAPTHCKSSASRPRALSLTLRHDHHHPNISIVAPCHNYHFRLSLHVRFLSPTFYATHILMTLVD